MKWSSSDPPTSASGLLSHPHPRAFLSNALILAIYGLVTKFTFHVK
uniref:Uncharacterized protein n=1 Tax=Anguilla anguilla TaxID=7936 RepID=A0A0E9TLH9_ANGAN